MTPKDEDETADMIRAAEGPIAVSGGGTRPIGRQVEGTVLAMAGVTGITLYEPGALTIVAKAGTPVAEIEAALETENQRLAFEPMDHRALLGSTGTPTIGGVIAGNVSGPRRVQAGAARDHLLGVRFVDGTGTVIKNGGRVMKNVTGYDLVKLMAGSRGTLGVLTEVSLKVLPDVEAQATLSFAVADLAQAVALMSAALGSPFEVTGATHDPEAGVTRLRIEGFAGSVDYRAGELERYLGQFGSAEVDRDRDSVRATWAAIRDVSDLAGREGDVWRLSVKPGDAPALVARMAAETVRLDWGGGLIWALVPEGTDLRARLGPFAGHATLVRASAATRAAIPVFQPEAPPVAALAAGLRAKFDPRGILNPGLMG